VVEGGGRARVSCGSMRAGESIERSLCSCLISSPVCLHLTLTIRAVAGEG
jgi:hypothetical protein